MNVLALGGFLSPWMLLWGLAVAVPITLHLLSRRRTQPRQWAAMQLLEKVIEQSARRIQIEQLILLAIRAAIPIVLAIAVARPYFNSSVGSMPASQRPARLNVLVIDTSYSMTYETGEESSSGNAAQISLLSQARAAAEQIILDAPSGDAFSIIMLGSPPVVDAITFDARSAVEAVDRSKICYSGVDVPSALALAERVVSERDSNILPGKPRVWVLSDFGQDGWKDSQACLVAWNRLSRVANVSRQAFLPDDRENWAVTSLRVPQSAMLSSVQSNRVVARVSRFGDSGTSEETTVSVSVDGVAVESQSVSLASGETANVILPIAIETPGQHVIEVRLPADRLTADNAQSAVVDVKERLSVLLISQSKRELAPFELALQTAPERFSVTSGSVATIVQGGTAGLEEFDIVVLCDLPRLSTSAATLLWQHTQRGGGIVVMHGRNAVADAWNPESQQFLSYRLVEPSAENDYRIDPLEYQSPITAEFREFPDAGLVTTPFFRFWRIEESMAQESECKVLLQFASGEPLIVQCDRGLGRTISVFSIPVAGSEADSWNAAATWPSFVPVFHRVAEQAARGDHASNLMIGETWAWRAPREVIADQQKSSRTEAGEQLLRVKIDRPDSVQDTVLASPDSIANRTRQLEYSQVDVPGIYSASVLATGGDETVNGRTAGGSFRKIAAQFATQESSLEATPSDQLPTEDIAIEDAAEAGSEADGQGRGFGSQLIWILAALLLTESSLAWFFGSRLQ